MAVRSASPPGGAWLLVAPSDVAALLGVFAAVLDVMVRLVVGANVNVRLIFGGGFSILHESVQYSILTIC